MLRSARPAMPTMPHIVDAWIDLGPGIADIFPDLKALWSGWGEPFCFRCGWLAPVKAWGDTRGWLEKAHLHDHQHGGGNEPLNLVPLCPLCHERQPDCPTRADGVAFVGQGPDLPVDFQGFVQWYTDCHYRELRPGRSAIHKLLRAQAAVGAQVAAAREAM